MGTNVKFRGRIVTASDLDSIRQVIAAHPGASRKALSKRLCEAWGWVQPNGQLRDLVCRGFMLDLHRRGLIELPPARHVSPNPIAAHRRPEPYLADEAGLSGRLADLAPLEFLQVRRRPEERVFNSLLEAYHYLGYTQPVGEHLKYLVFARGVPIACLSWSSAPRWLGPRDRFIGWSPQARLRNVRLLAYNSRFLILPWVKVEHLASHLLGRMVRILARDWERIYGHPLYFLETFIDPGRFRGTCYLAANWRRLGATTGRGKNAPSKKPTRPVKEILGYPLTPRFREHLQAVS
jgi:hypothetical protein